MSRCILKASLTTHWSGTLTTFAPLSVRRSAPQERSAFMIHDYNQPRQCFKCARDFSLSNLRPDIIGRERSKALVYAESHPQTMLTLEQFARSYFLSPMTRKNYQDLHRLFFEAHQRE